MSTAIAGGLFFTATSASASLAGAERGSWLVTGLAAAATLAIGAYLRVYVVQGDADAQRSDPQ